MAVRPIAAPSVRGAQTSQETEHAQAGSLLAIRETRSNCSKLERICVFVQHSTSVGRRSRDAEWQQQLADYLNLIAELDPGSAESDAVFYHEKCVVYTSLLDLVPPGPQSDKILADYVDFVGNSGLYQKSPAEWYVEPHTVLDRSQSDLRAALQGAGGLSRIPAIPFWRWKWFSKKLQRNLPSWAVSAK